MPASFPLISRSHTFDSARELERWIGRHHTHAGDIGYHASLAEGADGTPVLLVKLHRGGGHVGTYKCDVVQVDTPGGVLILAPLVVMWIGARPDDSSALGRLMIGHLVSAMQTFQAARSPRGERILIGSGNLTKAKAGRPFFESLGWRIVEPALRSPQCLYAAADMAIGIAIIEERIERAVAPLVRVGKIEAEPVRFAMLALP